MAWFAELKRRRWYCICGFSAISWYSKKLYDEWFGSLTEEEKRILEENKRAREEKRHREAMESLYGLAYAMGILNAARQRNHIDMPFDW